MIRRIKNPGDTPAEAYRFWHRRWCEILSDEPPADLLAAGRAGGLGFHRESPGCPGRKELFQLCDRSRGSRRLHGGEGEAIAEYDSYELGFRMLADASIDAGEQIEAGRFRILREPELWSALMSLLPILRQACRRAVEGADCPGSRIAALLVAAGCCSPQSRRLSRAGVRPPEPPYVRHSP